LKISKLHGRQLLSVEILLNLLSQNETDFCSNFEWIFIGRGTTTFKQVIIIESSKENKCILGCAVL